MYKWERGNSEQNNHEVWTDWMNANICPFWLPMITGWFCFNSAVQLWSCCPRPTVSSNHCPRPSVSSNQEQYSILHSSRGFHDNWRAVAVLETVLSGQRGSMLWPSLVQDPAKIKGVPHWPSRRGIDQTPRATTTTLVEGGRRGGGFTFFSHCQWEHTSTLRRSMGCALSWQYLQMYQVWVKWHVLSFPWHSWARI